MERKQFPIGINKLVTLLMGLNRQEWRRIATGVDMHFLEARTESNSVDSVKLKRDIEKWFNSDRYNKTGHDFVSPITD